MRMNLRMAMASMLALGAAMEPVLQAPQPARRSPGTRTSPYGLTFSYERAVDLSALAGKPWLRRGRKRRK